MTDPLTDAYLDAIAERIDCPFGVQAVQIGEYEACARAIVEHDAPSLLAEVRRLRADAEQAYSWARQIADRYGDDWPHEGGCMGDPADSGCPLCRLLAALDGGE